jgi:DNA-binding FadR family transcriptional regulator
MSSSRAAAPKPEARHGDLFAILQRIEGTSPVDVLNVRMMVEPQAAAAAASNATEADLAAIRDAHEAAMAANEQSLFESLDAEFHKRIFAATRNELMTCLHDILRVIRNQSPWIEIKRRSYTEARRQGYCADHAAIVGALYGRDAAGAAAAMRAHLLSVNQNLFSGGV